LKSTAGDLQPEVIKALWLAGWKNRIDMGEPEELKQALSLAGLPSEELFEKSFSKEARAELKANIQEAIELGVFGVPTMVMGNELFWGNDAIDDLNNFMNNQDLLDRDKLNDLLNSTPRAASQSL
jgi:2-hydroxychromene-2-carboxylate isomerase